MDVNHMQGGIELDAKQVRQGENRTALVKWRHSGGFTHAIVGRI